MISIISNFKITILYLCEYVTFRYNLLLVIFKGLVMGIELEWSLHKFRLFHETCTDCTRYEFVTAHDELIKRSKVQLPYI